MNYLMVLIENKRKKMYETAEKYGFTSELSIECSQQLDHLLNLLEQEFNHVKND
ncbi:Spo0E family sporulation regulatory protein-aspartic acid phosphatase [Niallia sp. Krafla_26]|uniref:Spo0E family sporulation regulatory protein-aspartic acid phosphatase n=1 Tax=Niallia sp. Krafla_26 TaxID=3064703 RepID=UPI003D175830